MNVELGHLSGTKNTSGSQKLQSPKNFEALQVAVVNLGQNPQNVNKKNITNLLNEINANKDSLNGVNNVTGETKYQELLNNLYSVVDQPSVNSNKDELKDIIKLALETSHSNYFKKVQDTVSYYKFNPVRRSINNQASTQKINAFGKDLKLQTTVTDGNCGVDSLHKALNNAKTNSVPQNVESMREEIGITCGKARDFLVQADVVVKQTEKNSVNQNDVNKLFEDLKSCFKTFAAFKSAIASTNTITWQNNLASIHNWENFAIYVRALDYQDQKTVLSNITGLFSISFDSTKPSSVLSGAGRSEISADNYVQELSDNTKKLYLDLQEMQTGLLSYGFVESRRDGCTQGTLFEFKNNQGQSLYFLLHGFVYSDGQQMNARGDVNSHWQYLTPAQ